MTGERRIVMLVDDDEVCLAVGREVLEGRYTLYPVSSGEQAIVILEKITPDLILLDIDMPGMNGYETIKHIKQKDETKDIPVIFLTARTDPGYELEGLSLGAIDYVTKPFAPKLLVQRIENHLLIASQRKELIRFNQSLQQMVDEQTVEIQKLQNAILHTVSEIVEAREELSGGHIERIQRYMGAMAEALQKQGPYQDEMKAWNIELLVNASQMHDVGKICISEAILNKPGRVSEREFFEIKKHPAFGSLIIDRMREMTDNHAFLDVAGIIAESHHERWDGSGYPEGLKGQEIPLAGRLMAVADVYDALVSARPYKQPMSHGESAEEIIRGSGASFDPAIIEVFKTLTSEFAHIAERRDVLI